MPVKIGADPEHGFDQPLELLSDCHRRIERFLAVLSQIAATAGGRSLGKDERRSLTTALKYFREAAPRHTADEEESLFPRMRTCGGEEAAAALARVDALEADHGRAGRLHVAVDEIFSDWLARGEIEHGKEEGLRQDLAELAALYSEHIRIEDQLVFPFAGRILDSATRLEIGREMAKRRGLQIR
jgi:hemerythrin-like domain-containing protein